MTANIEPIGHITASRSEAIDDDWDSVRASITLDADRFGPEALLGLDAFSHVEVVYLFDRVEGLTLSVAGLDAIDDAPVLDIKPYMVEFGPRGEVIQPEWSHELMVGYWTGRPS